MRNCARLLALLALVSCSPKVPQGVVAADQSKVVDVGGAELLEPQLDILFVIDNSGSMSSHQANLSANIGNFVAAFFQTVQVDFHIGVLTTDDDGGTYHCCGRLVTDPANSPAVIDRNTPDFRNILSQRMRVGTTGSATEKLFDPVYKALTPPNLNQANDGFLRTGATLAIVFITDAEDQSKIMTGPTLQNFLISLKGGSEKVLSYGVIVPSGVTNCPRDETTQPKYIEEFLSFSPSAGSNEFSLCDPQFGNRIAEIGHDLAVRVSSTLRLKRVPVVSTIRLMYGNQPIPPDPLTGWSFDAANNAIHIGPNFLWSAQPTGTQLRVYYTPTKFDDPTP